MSGGEMGGGVQNGGAWRLLQGVGITRQLITALSGTVAGNQEVFSETGKKLFLWEEHRTKENNLRKPV
jgi:hypothetical protein